MDPLRKADDLGPNADADDVSLERSSDRSALSCSAWEEQDDHSGDSDRPRRRMVHANDRCSFGDWPRSADSPPLQVPRDEADSGVLSEIFAGQNPDGHSPKEGGSSKRSRPTDQSLEQVLMTPRFLRGGGRPSSARASAAAAQPTERANVKKINRFLRKPILGLSSSGSGGWAPETVVTGAASILRCLRERARHGTDSRSLTPIEDAPISNQASSGLKVKTSSDSSGRVSFASSDDDDDDDDDEDDDVDSSSSNESAEGSPSECTEVNAPRGASPTLNELGSEPRCAGLAVQAPVKASSISNIQVDPPTGDATGNSLECVIGEAAEMLCVFPKEQCQEQPTYGSSYSTTFNTDAWTTSEAYNSAGPSQQQPCEDALEAEEHRRELLLHELFSDLDSTADPSTMVSPTRPMAQKPDRLAPRTVHPDVVRVDE
jgi:hypothetical protein